MMISSRSMKIITNAVRQFSLSSCVRESVSTKIDLSQMKHSSNNETDPCLNSPPYSFDQCHRRLKEIKRDAEIDFSIDGPIRSDWNRFPDDVDSMMDKRNGFENKEQERHVYVPGEIAIFRHCSLGKKRRPVLILSSSNRNHLSNATLLIVPFTTKNPNFALYQWKIFPEETCHRAVFEKNAILIFDYSTLVEYEHLETTLDSLKSDSFIATIKWWKQSVNSILP